MYIANDTPGVLSYVLSIDDMQKRWVEGEKQKIEVTHERSMAQSLMGEGLRLCAMAFLLNYAVCLLLYYIV